MFNLYSEQALPVNTQHAQQVAAHLTPGLEVYNESRSRTGSAVLRLTRVS